MTQLERIYRDMGSPRWFWPAVMSALFLLFVLSGVVND
jgi:hypothetical protein